MKVFAIFMTVLMLITGFDLCKDEDSYAGRQKTGFSKAANDAHEQSSACTPFCNCSCCPFSVIIPAGTTRLLADNTIIEKYENISSGTPIQIGSSVWQPPQFS